MKKMMFALIACSLMACSSAKKVSTEQGDNVNWSQYHTFNFYSTDARSDSASAKYISRANLLKQAISNQLQQKGLTLNTTNPDLLVNIGLMVNEEVQTRQTNYLQDAPRYIGQRRYTWKSEEVEVGRYNSGTITVHLVDAKQNNMVWKGVVESILPKNEAKMQSSVEEGIEKLFEQFPSATK